MKRHLSGAGPTVRTPAEVSGGRPSPVTAVVTTSPVFAVARRRPPVAGPPATRNRHVRRLPRSVRVQYPQGHPELALERRRLLLVAPPLAEASPRENHGDCGEPDSLPKTVHPTSRKTTRSFGVHRSRSVRPCERIGRRRCRLRHRFRGSTSHGFKPKHGRHHFPSGENDRRLGGNPQAVVSRFEDRPNSSSGRQEIRMAVEYRACTDTPARTATTRG